MLRGETNRDSGLQLSEPSFEGKAGGAGSSGSHRATEDVFRGSDEHRLHGVRKQGDEQVFRAGAGARWKLLRSFWFLVGVPFTWTR